MIRLATFALVVGLAPACSKPAPDDCQRYADRSAAFLRSRTPPPAPAMLANLAVSCRADQAAGRTPDNLDCVLAAADDAALELCWSGR